MKISTILAASALLIFGACTSKQAEQTATPTPEAEEPASEYAAPAGAGGKVIELTDAAEYAPGVKVPQLTILD